mgnify:CR=1 FL=1
MQPTYPFFLWKNFELGLSPRARPHSAWPITVVPPSRLGSRPNNLGLGRHSPSPRAASSARVGSEPIRAVHLIGRPGSLPRGTKPARGRPPVKTLASFSPPLFLSRPRRRWARQWRRRSGARRGGDGAAEPCSPGLRAAIAGAHPRRKLLDGALSTLRSLARGRSAVATARRGSDGYLSEAASARRAREEEEPGQHGGSRGHSGTKSSGARSPLSGVGGDTVVAAGHHGP